MASHKSHRSQKDQVHPETLPSSHEVGHFVSSSSSSSSPSLGKQGKKGERTRGVVNTKGPRVADMISALNAQSGKKVRPAVNAKLKRTSSTGSIRRSPQRKSDSIRHRSGSSGAAGRLQPPQRIKSSHSLGKGEFLGVTHLVSCGGSSDEEEDSQFSKSLGHNSIHQINHERQSSSDSVSKGGTLSGKVISIQGGFAEGELADSRSQKAAKLLRGTASPEPDLLHSKGPVIKPLGVVTDVSVGMSWKRTNSPLSPGLRTSEPRPIGERGTHLQKSGKSRIESNPFVQMDQRNRTLKSSQSAGRVLSTPSPSHKSRSMSREPSCSPLHSPSTSSTLNSSRGHESLERIEAMSIQSRIKLWAEKEQEAKLRQERLQASPRHSPKMSRKMPPSDEKQAESDGDDIYDDVVSIARPAEVSKGNDVMQEDELYESIGMTESHRENNEIVSSVEIQISGAEPPELPPRTADMLPEGGSSLYESIEHSTPSNGKSNGKKRENKKDKKKWKLKSPLAKRNKKKNAEEVAPPVEVNGKDKESEKAVKLRIGDRNSKKRKALKKRVVSGTDSLGSEHEAELTQSLDSLDDEAAMQNGDENVYEEVHTEERRLEASPEKRANKSPLLTVSNEKGEFVTHRRGGHSAPRAISSGPDFLESARHRNKAETNARKNRTLSREIHDIINTLDSDSEQFSPLFEESPPNVSQRLLEGTHLSAPANLKSSKSDPSIHRIGRKKLDSPLSSISPSHHGEMFQFSEESSSDSDTLPPMQSSLDYSPCNRITLKRQRLISDTGSDKEYDPTRTIVSTSVKDKYLSSPTCLRKLSLTPTGESSEGVIATELMYADAVWDRSAEDADELSFRVGDVIEILDMTDDVWWHGSVKDSSGWFPASFVRLRIGQESSGDELDKKPDSLSLAVTTTTAVSRPLQRSHSATVKRRMTIRRRDSTPAVPKKLSPTEVRAKVVEEILNTEKDYVQHLEDIVEGYLWRCREYNKLFDTGKVDTIFANIEAILDFQRDFLAELEARVCPGKMEDSQIGEVFVINRHEFPIYSEYCNNHPHAVNEMNSLQQNDQYAFFFESCRLLRDFGLQDISLEGYLLTPVQRICKYPLQLSELLKYTDESHPDHAHVVAAQTAMREVAMLINEHKRRMENIGKIGHWQETIDNWKGDDILETSTELIHSGELHKISKGHSQERHFFLFDHQLVYCKKDALGGRLSFKGRLDIDNCQITDLPDGAVNHGGNPVKNAWRMNNTTKDKWYTIYAKTPEIKKQWMDAFVLERERVREDADKGFHVPIKMKRAAVALASVGLVTRRRRKSFSKKHGISVDIIDSSIGPKKIVMSGSPLLSTGNGKKNRGAKKKHQSGSPMSNKKLS